MLSNLRSRFHDPFIVFMPQARVRVLTSQSTWRITIVWYTSRDGYMDSWEHAKHIGC